MSMLKERYIATALENVSDAQRQDVAREIRGAIDEMIEQRVEAGEPEDQAIEYALNELGEPGTLAASYDDRPRFFIGPGWYPAYILTMKRVLAVALPIIALVSLLVGIGLDGKGVGEAITETLGALFLAVVQIVFWITLGFVIAERTVGPEMPGRRNARWSVADLPDAPTERQVTLGSVLPDIIAMVIVAVLVLMQYARAVGIGRSAGESVRDQLLVNPDLAWGWQAGFLALVVLSLIAPILRCIVGYWTQPMMVLEIADSVLWCVFIVALAVSAPIINPAFAERVDAGSTWWQTGGQANMAIAVGVIAVSVHTAWDAWRGHREYRRLTVAGGPV
ncbi:MAG TPA: permease prefix domain 1-containing protein [Thermomicrobiales bacterium]|nr:permease prefix domain 1-containing protein [Thermomicrobiales bacterium]